MIDTRESAMSNNEEDAIASFQCVSGCTNEAIAKQYMLLANGDLNDALGLFLQDKENNELPVTAASASTMSNEANDHEANSRSRTNGRNKKYKASNSIQTHENSIRVADTSYIQTLIPDRETFELPLRKGDGDESRKEKNDFTNRAFSNCDPDSEGAKAFSDLFSPPNSVISSLSFAKVKEKCVREKKWVLVNIQNYDEFDCFKLNRDIWNAEIIQDLINDFFVFWQRQHNSDEGSLFCDLYKIQSFPHICIIDPFTGRSMKVWTAKRFQDAATVHSDLYGFVEKQQELEEQRKKKSSDSRRFSDIRRSGNEGSSMLDRGTPNEMNSVCDAGSTPAGTLLSISSSNVSSSVSSLNSSLAISSSPSLTKCSLTSCSSAVIASSMNLSSSELLSPMLSSPSSLLGSEIDYRSINTQLMELKNLRENRLKHLGTEQDRDDHPRESANKKLVPACESVDNTNNFKKYDDSKSDSTKNVTVTKQHISDTNTI